MHRMHRMRREFRIQIDEWQAHLREWYRESVGNLIDAGADDQTVAIARARLLRSLRASADALPRTTPEERDIYASAMVKLLEEDFVVNGASPKPGPLVEVIEEPAPAGPGLGEPLPPLEPVC